MKMNLNRIQPNKEPTKQRKWRIVYIRRYASNWSHSSTLADKLREDEYILNLQRKTWTVHETFVC